MQFRSFKKFYFFLATQQGSLEVAKILCENGAKIDEPQDDGWGPIHIGLNFNS